VNEPFVFGDITFTDSTDYAELARRALKDWAFGAMRWDVSALNGVERVLDLLRETPHAQRLVEGIAACLTDPDPLVRSEALTFFSSHPRAAGAERIVDLVAGDRALFAGVPDPMRASGTLEDELLRGLAARLVHGDPRALEVARAAVLRPGEAAPLMGALTKVDRDWVLARAEEIVRRTPAAGLPLLLQLQRDNAEITALGRQLAPLCRSDQSFEEYINRFIDDRPAREAILGAFHAVNGL
jgi:hypothetical protein